MSGDLFGPSRRTRPGRCRRELDAEVTNRRKRGSDPDRALLAAARGMADSMDTLAEHVAACRASHTVPATGLLMAQTGLAREYRETLAVLLGKGDDVDPLDQLLRGFSDAAVRD